MILLLLLACHPGADSADSALPFVETLAPDQVHLLCTNLPSMEDQPDLLEVGMDLADRWSYGATNSGALNAVREADGSTLYARTAFPPDLTASIDKVDAQGQLLWSYADLFLAGMGFSHGVVKTPEGDYIALDTSGVRLFSFDAAGTELWDMSFTTLPRYGSPNGITLATLSDGQAWLAITMLQRDESQGSDMVALFTLGDRVTPPSLVSWFDLSLPGGGLSWPHGPRFLGDDQLMLSLGSIGQVVALDLEGTEQWRIPTGSRLGTLSFPRDAAFLPDGTLVVADAGIEVVRIADPFGAFEVVSARYMPGVFTAEPLLCGTDGALPCLGVP